MDIPDLVRQELGDEEILAGVSIGDEDVVCLTPTRTIVYRSEGLISDEGVDSYPHEADRLKLSEGRRKSKFLIDYFDDTRSLSVPSDHTRDVLTLVLEGMLGADDVIDDNESVVGAFRFSEMTLIIAEKRLVRHIGATVWADDYESYPYEELTDLAFEEGSVATELAISINGHPQRIKIPREDARLVEKTVKTAVFEFYDVVSFEELRRIVGIEEDDSEDDDGDSLALGPDIDPLVTDDDDEEDTLIDTGSMETATVEPTRKPAADTADDEETPTAENDDDSEPRESTTGQTPDTATTAQTQDTATTAQTSDADTTGQTADMASTESTPTADPEALDELLEDADVASEEELHSLREQVGELSTAVKQQNQLLKKQHNAIKQLVEELRER